MARASHVVICLSQDAVTKTGFVNREVKAALEHADERPEGAVFVVPVRLEPCPLPDRLRHLHAVDLFGASGYDMLVRVLRS